MIEIVLLYFFQTAFEMVRPLVTIGINDCSERKRNEN